MLVARAALSKQRLAAFRWSLLLPAITSFTFFAVNALNNSQYSDIVLFGRFSSVIAVLSVTLISALCKFSVRTMSGALVVAVLTMLILTPFNGTNWRPCDRFKCGPFGAMFTGVFPSENALAMFVSVAVIAVFLIPSWWVRSVALLPLVLALYATESRTSQIALLVGLAVWAMVHLVGRNRRVLGSNVDPINQAIFRIGALGALAVYVLGFILINSASISTFSNRGGIWQRGLNALGDSWVAGAGMDRWIFLQSVGILPQLFPHSQYLLLLFGGGVVAILASFLMLVIAFRNQLRSGHAAGFASGYIAFLCVIGLTEIYWNPSAFDGYVVVLVPLIFMLLAPSAAHAEKKETGVQARSRVLRYR
ncbi:O-antigen ligase family protein [Arthrobacter sp. Bz4]|uniref:O-antigen ligase family protein n=1 Tax=Arthrobacter sp. Bz4 TaxID=2171979 RepID=UPI001403E704|nr:O-antigen ligase family protein [Arthrobacter sp. Bz4]